MITETEASSILFIGWPGQTMPHYYGSVKCHLFLQMVAVYGPYSFAAC